MTVDVNSQKEQHTIMNEDALLQRALRNVTERTKDWEIFDSNAEDRIPKFQRDELETGQVLGKGGFFVVSEITDIVLKQKKLREDGSCDEEETEDDDGDDSTEEPFISDAFKGDDEDRFQMVVQNRKFMAKHFKRKGKDYRYALKIMQDKCRDDPDKFVNTVTDLVLEARFLSVVRHPNIIKMRAMASGDPFQPSFFIVLDRLYDTLKDRIGVWHKKNARGWFFDFGQKREKRFLAERLMAAYDIASALEYLHDLNIIYRDLKPNNIGFDVRNDVKLYDFGLAVEHDPIKARKKNAAFRLTGDTGTTRYMAPEVALNHSYTETADIYSYGILLWEISQMEKPYGDMSDDMVERKVFYCGFRPKIDPKWPTAIRNLMKDCFASDPRRPPMSTICGVLRTEINKLSDKKLVDEGVFDSAKSAMSARY